MDESDRATRHEELSREIAQRIRRPEGPQASGQCLFCGDPLAPGLRWCNADCRDDWEARRTC